MKRAFDFCAALAGLTVLAPLLALIACAVYIEDRHTPLFLGRRVARSGSKSSFFRMVKFRTMIPDAWRTGVSSTAAGDRRVTRVGALLRRAKLDELPQLWNVLVGDMSLVGPRPQVEADAAMYTVEERRMFEARPGVTDIASVIFADEGEILAGATDPDLLYNQIIRPWKSRLALLYLERRTLASDVRIVLLTLIGAVSRRVAVSGIIRMLEGWNAGPQLLRVAGRSEPLQAFPPPGASEVVQKYQAA